MTAKTKKSKLPYMLPLATQHAIWGRIVSISHRSKKCSILCLCPVDVDKRQDRASPTEATRDKTIRDECNRLWGAQRFDGEMQDCRWTRRTKEASISSLLSTMYFSNEQCRSDAFLKFQFFRRLAQPNLVLKWPLHSPKVTSRRKSGLPRRTECVMIGGVSSRRGGPATVVYAD